MTVVIGLLVLGMALAFEAIIVPLMLLFILFSAGVFIIVVLLMLCPRCGSVGAMAAIVGGSITGLAGGLGWLDALELPIVGGFPTIVNGALVSLVLYVAFSLLLPRSNDAVPLAEEAL